MNPIQSDRPFIKHLDKVLFGIASAYCLLVLGWIVNQFATQKKQANQKPAVTTVDPQFMAYLQQSLNILEQEETQPKTLVNPSEGNLSTVAVAPSPEKVIERVYIPMYPPSGQSSSTSPQTDVNPATTNNLPTPPPLPSADSSPSTVPVLTPQETVAPEVAATSQSSSGSSHKLVGVLDAGEDSTAIFTFDGITRRFETGEAIGSSGGILMGVQNQKAVIYHNGNTRYIEVGQEF
ncbi:MAG: hypothetical protein AAGF26_12110 [Cyanobacteria bacterium P01_G01_bin.49]